MTDPALAHAATQITAAQAGVPVIAAFFDEPTFTVTYVVHDPETLRAAVIDSVLTFDPASGRTSHEAADRIIAHVQEAGLHVDWHLETHAHADHLSAAPYLQQKLGGKIAIGAHICTVQETFGKLFNAGSDFQRDGSDFDQLWKDGDTFLIGELSVTVLHVPGHTPACVAYVIGDAVFVGDTMFMPDYGTARADFPGGDARTLFRSLRRLLELPPQTRRLLGMVRDHVGAWARAAGVHPRDLRFTRREIREATGWGDTQLKLHLSRLESLEYLLVRRDGARFVYELLWAGEGDGDQSVPFVMGLIDVESLKRQHYDAERSGVTPEQSPPGRGAVGGRSGLGRAVETPRNGAIVPFMPAAAIPTPESTSLDGAGPARGYARRDRAGRAQGGPRRRAGSPDRRARRRP
ncbi:hypothetical protein LTR94_026804, partial [Friedmanniomyces endolithicus]